MLKLHNSLIFKTIFVFSILCISLSYFAATKYLQNDDNPQLTFDDKVLIGLFSNPKYEHTAPKIVTSFDINRLFVLDETHSRKYSQSQFVTELYFSGLTNNVGEFSNEPSIRTLAKTATNIIKISNNPVKTGFLSSRFGMRKDPINGLRRLHRGIDIAARYGTIVNPLGAGEVVFAGVKAGYGNTVDIKHSSTVTTRYAHLQQFSVNEGQFVSNTDTIGLVGSTGRSTGPHLHLEILFNDRQVDPQVFLSNHYGPNAQDVQIAKVTPKPKQELKPKVKVVKPIIVAKAKTKQKEFPDTSNFPQITYQDYVNSVDGLYGFTAPK